MGLPSSRFFLWAERLRFRDGAVRGALAARQAFVPRSAGATEAVTESGPVDAIDKLMATGWLERRGG